ncbi:MAG: pyridoxamine 5'-phosphate oxidase family protein [Oscillospiraceae bacterium]|nr:pyridoxamine 5'-phosphate oxidase family protein [Oscillospiraceae bacterium]
MKKTVDASGIAALLERSAPIWAGTVGLDGRPQLRQLCFLFQQEGALYFLTAKSRRLYAELCKTPYIQLCVTEGETEDCLRISGKVCFTEEKELIARCLRERPEMAAALGGDEKALIAFFLLGVRGERTAVCEEVPLESWTLPDPSGVLVGITIKKKTELRDRLTRILERREAEPPAVIDETAKLYDGALFLFAEAAKALWPRMDIRPIERAAVFETWDQREHYTRLAAERIGNAVIDKPEDFSYWLSPETLKALSDAE